ncbi:MAG: dTDP-4-dehydrorhamnose 3,5-epimerase [Saprospiraceae bacterium]|jgi:dTDP-4-dehydrorhamnose 3,5-epimerase
MIFHKTPLSGAYYIDLAPFSDERGLFARTFCKKEFEAIGHHKEFVQLNHSRNTFKGTIRGLHYQNPPFSEIKLIRCIKGAVYDILVDLRKDSPTFLQHYGLELSEENMRMIYIPEGFAHGFQTLEDNTELIYHHTAFYTPGMESGLKFDNTLLGINWPLPPTVVSEKDQTHPPIDAAFAGIILK